MFPANAHANVLYPLLKPARIINKSLNRRHNPILSFNAVVSTPYFTDPTFFQEIHSNASAAAGGSSAS